MNAEQIVGTLASQLDDDGLVALQTLVKQASMQAVQAAQVQQAHQEDAVQKLAADLANAGYELHEVEAYLNKVAEAQKEAEDCQAIKDDCDAMGVWIGKTAGEVASQVILQNLSSFVQKHAEDEEEEKSKGGKMPPELLAKMKEKEDEGSEEEEDEEEEKEASARAQQLAKILAPVLLRNG
jgi:hypothetical protein